MKIILTQEVSGLGSAGDVVEVKDGYGRNYLLPQGYAIRWTRGAEKEVISIRRARAAREIRDRGARRRGGAATVADQRLPLRPGWRRWSALRFGHARGDRRGGEDRRRARTGPAPHRAGRRRSSRSETTRSGFAFTRRWSPPSRWPCFRASRNAVRPTAPAGVRVRIPAGARVFRGLRATQRNVNRTMVTTPAPITDPPSAIVTGRQA